MATGSRIQGLNRVALRERARIRQQVRLSTGAGQPQLHIPQRRRRTGCQLEDRGLGLVVELYAQMSVCVSKYRKCTVVAPAGNPEIRHWPSACEHCGCWYGITSPERPAKAAGHTPAIGWRVVASITRPVSTAPGARAASMPEICAPRATDTTLAEAESVVLS